MRPHPGKVNTQVKTISFTTEKLMAEILRTAPTPIIAVVLAWVVETGSPNTELINRQMDAAMSAEKP